MKTNFYIKDNKLIFEVVLEPMSFDPTSRVRFGMPSLMNEVKKIKLPKNTRLGKCLSPTLGLDNYFLERSRGTWVFELKSIEESPAEVLEIKENKPKKTTKRSKKTKSTRAPRKK